MKLVITVGLCILLGPSNLNAKDLFKFKTDYCTAFSEGTFSHPDLWKECCFEHDLRYWFGGTRGEQSFSDLQLKKCVENKAGSFYSNLMYYAVRAGHFSPIKHKTYWSWGWGRSINDRFKTLNKTELEVVKNRIIKLNLGDTYTQSFLKKYNIK